MCTNKRQCPISTLKGKKQGTEEYDIFNQTFTVSISSIAKDRIS